MAIAQRADRRADLLEVAARLFSRQGYHGTSMQNLAEEVGVLRGSLYAHIDSKEDLLFEIVDRGADRFMSRMNQVVLSELSPKDKLRRAVLAHVTTVAEHLQAATVFLNDWRLLSPQRRALILEKRDRYEALVREIIEEGIEWGDFPEELDAGMAAIFVLSVVNWLYQWFDPSGPRTADDLASLLSEMILSGLIGGP